MMFFSTFITVASAGLALGAPIAKRVVSKLDAAATAEAQQRDDTATRAFSAVPITTSDGQCLSVDPLGGDFRSNLVPVVPKACDGSANQKWDIITAGKHNNQANAALIVSTLTNGCMNFDDRRAAGDRVNLFSCGGRADGGGAVTNSQLFQFAGGATSIPFVPLNGNNAVCITTGNAGRLVEAACDPKKPTGGEVFNIGGGKAGTGAASSASSSASQAASTSKGNAAAASSSNGGAVSNSSKGANTLAVGAGTACAPPVTVTVTAGNAASSTPASALTNIAVSSSTSGAAGNTAAPTKSSATVSLSPNINPSAVAESHARDDTATRALSSTQIKTSDGQCLSVDPNAGDFRENLIPINVKPCDNSPNQKFDVITKGKHNNVAGTALLVSSLTQGCINFDDRRKPGNQVLIFSCGGRADGSGEVQSAQLFPFKDASAPLALAPVNNKGTQCLLPKNGNLDVAACDSTKPTPEELFTFA